MFKVVLISYILNPGPLVTLWHKSMKEGTPLYNKGRVVTLSLGAAGCRGRIWMGEVGPFSVPGTCCTQAVLPGPALVECQGWGEGLSALELCLEFRADAGLGQGRGVQSAS